MSDAPPRLPPRDSGDAWVEGPDGRRYWGRYGAAGLLVHDPAAGILLQHRAEWSHFGGTWGLPGGARHEGESAVAGAIREAGEEAGVPAEALTLAFASVFDLGYWSYETVVARAIRSFRPRIGDAESLELRWVLIDEVDALPLHPGFGASWPLLRARLGESVRVVVDAANVVGSRPDGWWKDRAGAASKLLDRVEALSAAGLAATEFGLPAGRIWPQFSVVLEGQARAAAAAVGGVSGRVASLTPDVQVVCAEASGDDAIVAEVDRLARLPRVSPDAAGTTVVVTADRELSGRVAELGAEVRGPGWLLDLLDAAGRA